MPQSGELSIAKPLLYECSGAVMSVDTRDSSEVNGFEMASKGVQVSICSSFKLPVSTETGNVGQFRRKWIAGRQSRMSGKALEMETAEEC